jgi:hypothetical protein
MKKYSPKRALLSAFVVVVLVQLACGPFGGNNNEAEEPDLAATQASLAKTQDALDAPPQATEPPPPTQPPPTQPLPTQPPPTADQSAKSTSYAQGMYNRVQTLYSDGYLKSTAGRYHWINNFSESFAQIGYIKPYLYEIETTDLVMVADVAWETAAEGANIKNSGCGFYFGFHGDPAKYHVLLFSLDGNVKLFRMWSKTYIEAIGSGFYRNIDYMGGNVELMLILQDKKIQGFVNGRLIFERPNQKVAEGIVGFGISSGINTGFGTRCSFTNVKVWELYP